MPPLSLPSKLALERVAIPSRACGIAGKFGPVHSTEQSQTETPNEEDWKERSLLPREWEKYKMCCLSKE
jgi:hypothetical protein